MQSRFSKGAREAYAKWWIRMLSYNLESSDLPSPLGAKAHSSHGMVASKAKYCNAAGWFTPSHSSGS